MKLNPGLKGRRIKILGLALVLLGIIVVIGIVTSGKKEGAGKKEKENIRVLTEADLEREKWRASAEKDIDQLKSSQKELVKEINSLKDKLSAKEQKENSLPPLPPPPKNVFSPPPPPPQAFNGGGVMGKTTSGIRVFSPETVSMSSRQTQKEESNTAKGNWVPSGSFVKGILLSGLDAPTGVQSKTNPYPVLIRLSEPANLPNLRRLDVKECFATGGGYGDLASERAYIRLESISCVLNSGKVIDTQVKGYIAGEDGKVGLRGRLVSKQGQFLSRALLAGFASGLGQAFSSFGTVTSLGAGGTVTVGPQQIKDIGIAATGGGVSKAAEKLADYYLKLADEVFPVVEIDSGRTVDVVVLQGKELAPRGRLDSRETNEPIPGDVSASYSETKEPASSEEKSKEQSSKELGDLNKVQEERE